MVIDAHGTEILSTYRVDDIRTEMTLHTVGYITHIIGVQKVINEVRAQSSMTSPRVTCFLPLFPGKLYIAGGFNGASCLLSVEMYDPARDQWSVLAGMSMLRSGVSMVVCEDRVYAIGGFDGEHRLDSGEHVAIGGMSRRWIEDV